MTKKMTKDELLATAEDIESLRISILFDRHGDYLFPNSEASCQYLLAMTSLEMATRYLQLAALTLEREGMN